MSLQCVVTSYQRPKYLRQCLESLRQDPIELYVVDGGMDFVTNEGWETLDMIREFADAFLLLHNNPGADILKTEGIKRFVTNPEFMVTSDDLVFPLGWSALLTEQYYRINAGTLTYAMISCPTEMVIHRHDNPAAGLCHYEQHPSGVRLMSTTTAMVAGAMMNTEATKRVGYFPCYGKTGEGDFAISRRFHKIGLNVGYLREPVLQHIGRSKQEDYPDYTEEFRREQDLWMSRARADAWEPSE